VRDLESSTGARRRSKCTASLCTGVRRPRRAPGGSPRPRLHPPMVCPPPSLHRAQRVTEARLPGNSRQNPKISRAGPERGRAARAPDPRRRHQRQDRGCIRGAWVIGKSFRRASSLRGARALQGHTRPRKPWLRARSRGGRVATLVRLQRLGEGSAVGSGSCDSDSAACEVSVCGRGAVKRRSVFSAARRAGRVTTPPEAVRAPACSVRRTTRLRNRIVRRHLEWVLGLAAHWVAGSTPVAGSLPTAR